MKESCLKILACVALGLAWEKRGRSDVAEEWLDRAVCEGDVYECLLDDDECNQ